MASVQELVAPIVHMLQGASAGRGRGNAFLRHVERSRCLAFVLDLSGGQAGALLTLEPAAQLQVLQVHLSHALPAIVTIHINIADLW